MTIQNTRRVEAPYVFGRKIASQASALGKEPACVAHVALESVFNDPTRVERRAVSPIGGTR